MAGLILGGSVVILNQTYDKARHPGGGVTLTPWGRRGFVEITPAGRVLVYGDDPRFLPHELEGADAVPFVLAAR